MAHRSLTDLPLEVLRNILVFLDSPALLQVSRTSHFLRTLSRDPVLHRARLERVRYDLNILLRHRLPRSSISPPNAWIWLSKTNVLSRSISKSLVKIRLNHNLERRPRVEHLVERAKLPEYCARLRKGMVSPTLICRQEEVRKLRLKEKLGRLLERRPSIDKMVEMNIMPAECASGSSISPKLVGTRRQVMKENLKDNLRTWVKGRAIEEQKRKGEQYDEFEAGISVKAIIKRFSARNTAADLEVLTDKIALEKKAAQIRWGRGVELERERQERRRAAFGTHSQPSRAHVLGLKRFWEGVIKAAAG